MFVDEQATKKVPSGWTIWTTGTVWQAMKDAALEWSEKREWGPMRRSAQEALGDIEGIMTDETYDNTAQKAAAQIVRADGVLGVTIVPIDDGVYGRVHYINEEKCAPYVDGPLLKDYQAAALSLLRKHPQAHAVLFGEIRILLKRWKTLMVAATAIRRHPINKSMGRMIDRAGRRWDRPDPDDTQLGKELGKLERTDPAVGAAAAQYDETVADIIEGKFG